LEWRAEEEGGGGGEKAAGRVKRSHSFFNWVGDFRFVERKSLAGNAPYTLVHRYSTVVYEQHSIVQYSTVYYSTLPHTIPYLTSVP